jgi:hypothetical protein
MKISVNNNTNTLKMFYSIKKCFDLIEDEYDFVIRCRFDLIIQEKFILKNIIDKLINDNYDIYIPTHIFNYGSMGLNDQIAIGKFEKMKIYSNMYSNLNNVLNKSTLFRPENLLETYIMDNKINVMTEPRIDFKIVRSINPEFNRESFKDFQDSKNYFLNL